MEPNLRTLGPSEAKVVLSLQEQGREVVKAAEIISMLGSEKTARKVIRNLLRKGWFTRLTGGRYMVLPAERGPQSLGENNPLALAAAAVEGSYIGWWSAAAFHGFTTQQPAIVFVAVAKQTPHREIEGTQVRFVAEPNKLFGAREYDVYGRKILVSGPEKTIIDCVDRPDLAGGPTEVARIVHAGMADADPEILLSTATQMHSNALLQRLGFLTDIVGRPFPDELRTKLRENLPRSARSTFGRAKGKEGDIGYVANWGLVVHVSRSDLLAEVPQIQKAGEGC